MSFIKHKCLFTNLIIFVLNLEIKRILNYDIFKSMFLQIFLDNICVALGLEKNMLMTFTLNKYQRVFKQKRILQNSDYDMIS